MVTQGSHDELLALDGNNARLIHSRSRSSRPDRFKKFP